MKTRLRQFSIRLLLLLHCLLWGDAMGSTIQLEFEPQYEGERIQFGKAHLTNASGESFSFTRLDFIISQVALCNATSGTWIEAENFFGFVSLNGDGSQLALPRLPEGDYRAIRFLVGVPPEINHGNPARFGGDHPLNPNLNKMHWSWADGYIFMALEGHRSNEDDISGFSYHLGNDWLLREVELPVRVAASHPTLIKIGLELATLLPDAFKTAPLSTHSRRGDAFAEKMAENLDRAFKTLSVEPLNQQPKPLPQKLPTIAHGATPYPLTFSDQFPIPELPHDNPLTEEGVALGKELFFDKRLSQNNLQSCASCHVPGRAFSDSQPLSIGVEGHAGSRNSMPLFNLAWKKEFFWDGRARSLREQVLEPIQDPLEMHESLDNVITKLAAAPEYPALFERAFGTTNITADTLAMALEQFLLTEVSFDSRFDRALAGTGELTEEEKRGFELFVTEYDPRREQFGADCFHCHGGPFFTSHGFANNGLENIFSDPGRYRASTNQYDRGKFAIPSLRNVALTAPYMHDGRFNTLEEVVEHYASGVKRSTTLDPNMAKHPEGGIPLSDEDKKALVAFLKTLTDERYLSPRSSRLP